MTTPTKPNRVSIQPVRFTRSPSADRPRRLTLQPEAFLKLMYCCHAAETEIAGFGVSTDRDPLTIERFELIRQTASAVTVEFDDEAVADFFDEMASTQVSPARCGRLWIHTHPGASASPSGTDERTFNRAFSACDWAAMIIVSREEETFCRLRFSAGPGGEMLLPVVFDWSSLPTWLLTHHGRLDAIVSSWQQQLQNLVQVETYSLLDPQKDRLPGRRVRRGMIFDEVMTPLSDDEKQWLDWFEERQAIEEELEIALAAEEGGSHVVTD